MSEREIWDLEEIKRKIADLPPGERDATLREYPHLTTPELDDVPPNPAEIVPIAPSKIQQIREAGREQLTPEEYETLESLLGQLQVYGMTPYVNVELGKLLAKIEWQLEITESPEWAEALIACDEAFLGSELKEMCEEYGLSPHGHKKQLCGKLYRRKVPEVVEIMEPYLQGAQHG